MSMIQLLRKLWARPWADWWLLGQAVFLTVIVRLSLAIWSIRRVVQGLYDRGRRRAQKPNNRDDAYHRRVTWAANAVGYRLLPKRPCLTQALVVQYLLLRRGDDSASLHVGVTKGEDGQLLAHAWVQREDRVIIGGTASPQRYQRFADLEERLHVKSSTSQ